MKLLERYHSFISLSFVHDFGEEESSVSRFVKVFFANAYVYIALFNARSVNAAQSYTRMTTLQHLHKHCRERESYVKYNSIILVQGTSG